MRFPLAFLAALATTATPALAQRQIGTPEQRIERLERQLRQVQGRLFPNGQPVETAGLPDDPAASQTVVVALSNRIDNLERQLADTSRRADEGTGRIAALEAEIARLRSDSEARSRSVERTPSASVIASPLPAATTATTPPPGSTFTADGEGAYDAGYQLWVQKKYERSIASLRAFSSSFPGHRRVSWANNLVGRALLDSGQPRAAAEALLANYRANPKGERAPDSLYYLGQSLLALKQPTQACKAYTELQTVYGDSMRGELKALLPAARDAAGCR
jgi:TolA-binding protein